MASEDLVIIRNPTTGEPIGAYSAVEVVRISQDPNVSESVRTGAEQAIQRGERLGGPPTPSEQRTGTTVTGGKPLTQEEVEKSYQEEQKSEAAQKEAYKGSKPLQNNQIDESKLQQTTEKQRASLDEAVRATTSPLGGFHMIKDINPSFLVWAIPKSKSTDDYTSGFATTTSDSMAYMGSNAANEAAALQDRELALARVEAKSARARIAVGISPEQGFGVGTILQGAAATVQAPFRLAAGKDPIGGFRELGERYREEAVAMKYRQITDKPGAIKSTLISIGATEAVIGTTLIPGIGGTLGKLGIGAMGAFQIKSALPSALKGSAIGQGEVAMGALMLAPVAARSVGYAVSKLPKTVEITKAVEMSDIYGKIDIRGGLTGAGNMDIRSISIRKDRLNIVKDTTIADTKLGFVFKGKMKVGEIQTSSAGLGDIKSVSERSIFGVRTGKSIQISQSPASAMDVIGKSSGRGVGNRIAMELLEPSVTQKGTTIEPFIIQNRARLGRYSGSVSKSKLLSETDMGEVTEGTQKFQVVKSAYSTRNFGFELAGKEYKRALNLRGSEKFGIKPKVMSFSKGRMSVTLKTPDIFSNSGGRKTYSRPPDVEGLDIGWSGEAPDNVFKSMNSMKNAFGTFPGISGQYAVISDVSYGRVPRRIPSFLVPSLSKPKSRFSSPTSQSQFGVSGIGLKSASQSASGTSQRLSNMSGTSLGLDTRKLSITSTKLGTASKQATGLKQLTGLKFPSQTGLRISSLGTGIGSPGRFGFKLPSLGFGTKDVLGRQRGRKSRKYFYTPSLAGIGLGLKAFRIPKSASYGLSPRPVIKRQRRSNKMAKKKKK